jgi:hypothetical protein
MSWPPTRRMFSGSVLETEVALIPVALLRPAAAPACALAVGCGETVGNRPEGSVLVVPGSGIGGSAGSGGSELMLGGGVVGEVVAGAVGFGATISTEPEAAKDAASFAVAFAVRVTWLPTLASFRTGTLACSSSAWPCGRFPSVQVAPAASGQTENRGAAVPLTCWIAALTVTCLVLLWVLQTQIT